MDNNKLKEPAFVPQLASEYQYNGYVVSLNEFIKNNKLKICTFNSFSNDSKRNLDSDIFSEAKDLSVKKKVLEKLRLKLICKMAKMLNCDVILMDLCSNDIASRIIGDISMGELPNDLRTRKLLIMFPLKNLSRKEIIVIANGDNNSINTKLLSVQDVSKRFIDNLDKESSNTLSTVCRISQKLTNEGELDRESTVCFAELAKKFSHLVSCNDLDVENLDLNNIEKPGFSNDNMFFKYLNLNEEEIFSQLHLVCQDFVSSEYLRSSFLKHLKKVYKDILIQKK